MKALYFSTSFISHSLPLLRDCYGFDITEISEELSHIVVQHVRNHCVDKDLENQCKDENGYVDAVTYGLKSNDEVSIPTTDDFEEQYFAIEKLCQQYDLTDTQILSLCFMAAIFNRNQNHLFLSPEMEDMRQEAEWNARFVRPDLLKLFIALNQKKPKGNAQMAVSIKICYKDTSPETISNKGWWFTHMMTDYLHQKLGDMTIKAAQEELALFYNDEKGRKSSNPYLNYIIHGTYNLVKTIFPSDKVTVKQCNFLLQYLRAIGQVKTDEKLNNVNNLQSHVRELLKSQFTPVQKHIKAKQYKGLPLYQRVLL